ncbi:hypothetical protein SAMN05192558_10291 [Actinokineospora alba]|uniref:Uncharacterized protein n=1 Tax=Actinokineospora alba TaxID=504798 RepID=A0A1H0HFF6_9PSEU|nr:hypothetical protein [Actinokineospora alba]TDP64910.1 hypothetical protein C8E96_0388 [Actinokineospora alba]SDH49171.1 hypothetical protein SAMN05421871_101212 [Actinokineospora alba]SDO17764.1 hypothetical protein SAMN05192558_10291 [Actinokineospora alba]
MRVDRGVDLTWLLTHGAGMAWQYAMSVQTSMTDIDAAFDDGNYPACVESCAVALRAIAYCAQVGDGYVVPPSDMEHQLHLATDDSATARALRNLPVPAGASRDDAERARAVVREHEAALSAALPVTVPVIRTSSGFFPTVRIAASLEKLRAEHGLGAIDWNQWDI